jgi:hypothetical protein
MALEPHDADEMRRFLLDELPLRLRIQVERRFARDPEYFEALCALEEDLILAHLRGELREEWREPFNRAFLETAARRQRVDEVAGFLAALPETPSGLEGPAAVPRALSPRDAERARARTPWRSPWPLGLAAMLVVGIGGAFLLRPGGSPSTSVVVPPAGPEAPTAPPPVYELQPGTRDPSKPGNLIQIDHTRPSVALRIVVSNTNLVGVEAGLRRDDGETASIPGAPVMRPLAAGTEVLVDVPTRMLPPGDYRLGLTGVAANGRRVPLPSRFFSIAP